MVDAERGSAAVECDPVDAQALDIGREGDVPESGEEAYVRAREFKENWVKTPLCI